MEQGLFFWQAEFFHHLEHAAQLFAKVSQAVRDLRQFIVDSNHQDLIEYIREVLPEMKAKEVSKAVFFHEVTDKKLPPCYFVTGDLLVWNDDFIPPGHPARSHCGEGPFKVVQDESYLVEIKTQNDDRRKMGVRVGSDRLVLLNLQDQNLIIAHGSLFVVLR